MIIPSYGTFESMFHLAHKFVTSGQKTARKVHFCWVRGIFCRKWSFLKLCFIFPCPYHHIHGHAIWQVICKVLRIVTGTWQVVYTIKLIKYKCILILFCLGDDTKSSRPLQMEPFKPRNFSVERFLIMNSIYYLDIQLFRWFLLESVLLNCVYQG